jgi:hypothetical protein
MTAGMRCGRLRQEDTIEKQLWKAADKLRKIQGYLLDTCLSAQDKYGEIIRYFTDKTTETGHAYNEMGMRFLEEGDTLADAILMGTDAASGWVLLELEEGKAPPPVSPIDQIHPEQGGIVSLLVLDMDSYAEKYGNKAIRKNLTIPAWLNTFGESHNLNFSQVLQDALTIIAENYGGDHKLDNKTAGKLLKAAGIE